jgi:hypothetical protein
LPLQQVLDFLAQLGDAEDFLCGAEVEERLFQEESFEALSSQLSAFSQPADS